MKIKFIDIQNFRKLKECRIYLGDRETLFVGANNSGKTSAIDALVNFLDTDKQKRFSVTDFTLSNWSSLNEYAISWQDAKPENAKGTTLVEWQKLCPSIDVWIDANLDEVHKVSHLIPSFNWSGEPLGVRLIFQPKDLEKLKIDFFQTYSAAKTLTLKNPSLSLWPRDMKDYLGRELKSHFTVKAYLLDSTKYDSAQLLLENANPLDSYPFNGIFKVDTIDAQRGHTDPNGENSNESGSLSSLLNEYYNRHLNPNDLPNENDIEALTAIDEAKNLFDGRLEKAFESALGEIKTLGYPGFSDPDIKLSSKVNPIEGLDHDASVIFNVQKNGLGSGAFSLPEKYNGLGYKNLIHIVFKLITYRDKWQRVGKAQRRRAEKDLAIEPIHLVLVEEPEAHLHAQVQQVFIRKAYDVLRKNVGAQFTTQMVVSSHSSYIAHEAGFEKLQYFRRKSAIGNEDVPSAEVVDLSKVFSVTGKKLNEAKRIVMTSRFVSRYLKTIHCDLFFANGIVLVEGAAERILVPHFIKHKYSDSLDQSYISILEVGGAHSHRLKLLIEAIGMPTLVITDTDAVVDGGRIMPQRGKGHSFGSNVLRKWFDFEGKSLDEILDLPDNQKIKGNVRVAYQSGIQLSFDGSGNSQEAIPYTFEDAIVLTNLTLFKKLNSSTGMVKKMSLATQQKTLDACCVDLFDALKGTKAQMALDLLYEVTPEKLIAPEYLVHGLDWLKTELAHSSQDFVPAENVDHPAKNEVD